MSDRELIIRIVLAVLLGGIIGFEREAHRRAAGLRTHILVCVGSALITVTSIYLAEKYSAAFQNCDPGRIASGIVTGIGFLGAGAIIQEKASVFGLTTAASIWAVAGVGLAVGCGFYKAATFSTLAIFITLVLLGKFTRKYMGKKGALQQEEEGV